MTIECKECRAVSPVTEKMLGAAICCPECGSRYITPAAN